VLLLLLLWWGLVMLRWLPCVVAAGCVVLLCGRHVARPASGVMPRPPWWQATVQHMLHAAAGHHGRSSAMVLPFAVIAAVARTSGLLRVWCLQLVRLHGLVVGVRLPEKHWGLSALRYPTALRGRASWLLPSSRVGLCATQGLSLPMVAGINLGLSYNLRGLTTQFTVAEHARTRHVTDMVFGCAHGAK
jgi:hypothetical protein